VRTERYDVIGATRRARRFAVVCGVCRSGLGVSSAFYREANPAYFCAESRTLLWAKERIWSTYSSLSG